MDQYNDLYLNNNEIKKMYNLIHVPGIITHKNINGYNLFSKNLSFMQRDKYAYEFAYMLKKKYPYFKNEWIKFRDLSNKNMPIFTKGENCWNAIDSSILKKDLSLELHIKALNILSEPFCIILNLINNNASEYFINMKISSIIDEHYIYDKIKYMLTDKFMVNLDYSSYEYNEETKLYKFNNTKHQTMKSLKKYIDIFKNDIENLYLYFSSRLNIVLLNNILYNTNNKSLLCILDIIKTEIKFSFNNETIFEIPYKKKILNLKHKTILDRNYMDHYTTCVETTYLNKYNKHPEYIKSIFGNDINILNKIQMLLGSLITGSCVNKFVIFYGSGSNSKSKLISILKNIFDGLFLEIDYEKYINEQDSDVLIEKYNFDTKRIISIGDIDTKTFFKNKLKFIRIISNRKFNFIGICNKKFTIPDNNSFNTRLEFINFPYCFVDNPKNIMEKQIIKNLNVNKDFIFTWLIKGAMKYLNNNTISHIELEANEFYDSEYNFDSNSDTS